jgi:integrase
MANISYRLRGEIIYVTFYVSDHFRPEFSTGERVPTKYWDATKQRVKPALRAQVEINQHLHQIKSDLLQVWRDHKSVDEGTLKELARKTIKGEVATLQKKTIYPALDLFLSQYKQEKEKVTLGKYNALKAQLLAFNPVLDFAHLDFNFYDAFKKHLYTTPNPRYHGCILSFDAAGDYYTIIADGRGERVGIFDDTVFKYLVNLKTFLAWATKRGYEVNPSFKTWEIIKRKHTPISLTLDELERVEQLVITTDIIRKAAESKVGYNPEKVKLHLEIARDYLVSECRTGARVSDLKRFNINDVKDMVWTYTPKKGSRLSNKKVSMPFVGYSLPAWFIFQKHGFKLPVISEQKLNQNIKKVCKLAGIDQEISITRWQGSKRIRMTGPKYSFLSSHTGRKTCITLLHTKFETPFSMIMEMVGISSISTLQHYLAESEIDQKRKYLEKYQNQSVMSKAI